MDTVATGKTVANGYSKGDDVALAVLAVLLLWAMYEAGVEEGARRVTLDKPD